MSVRLCICVSVFLCDCLSVCLCICASVCLGVVFLERAEQPAQWGEQGPLAEVRQPSLGNGARHERLFAQTDQERRGPRRQAGRAVGHSERERKLGRLCDFGFGNGRHGSVLGSRAQAGRN